MTIPSSKIESVLATKIATLDSNSAIEDFLFLAAAAANLTSKENFVDSAGLLPDLQGGASENSSFSSGTVAYAPGINVPLITVNSKYVGFDGRQYSDELNIKVWSGGGIFAANTGHGNVEVSVNRSNWTSAPTLSSPVTVQFPDRLTPNWSNIYPTAADGMILGSADNFLYGMGPLQYFYTLDTTGSTFIKTAGTTSTDAGRVGTLVPIKLPFGNGAYSRIAYISGSDKYVDDNGTAWAANNALQTNTWGQLGDGQKVNRSSPVTVIGGVTWEKVKGYTLTSGGISTSGVLYAWGINTAGQLGTNDAIAKSSPVTVVGGITTWTDFINSDANMHGITSAGVVYSWGASSYYGSVGDGQKVNRSSPVTVVGGITWETIPALNTSYARFAISNTGVLYAWGEPTAGRLGTNNTISRSSPVTVVGGITNWIKVVNAGQSSAALTASGDLYQWGTFNGGGALDTSNGTVGSSPVSVSLASGWLDMTIVGRTGDTFGGVLRAISSSA